MATPPRQLGLGPSRRLGDPFRRYDGTLVHVATCGDGRDIHIEAAVWESWIPVSETSE